MADNPQHPSTKRGAPNAATPVTVTPEYCFERYKSGVFKSIAELHRALKSEGHKISRPLLSQWSEKNPEWAMLKTRLAETRVERAKGIIDALHDQAHKLRADSFTGLSVRLVERLADTIPQLEVKVPADLITCLDAADRLKGLTHDIRGAEITRGDVGLRLMDSTNRNPVVPMAPFRTDGTRPGKPRDAE